MATARVAAVIIDTGSRGRRRRARVHFGLRLGLSAGAAFGRRRRVEVGAASGGGRLLPLFLKA